MSVFNKNRPVVAELLRADRRTDIHDECYGHFSWERLMAIFTKLIPVWNVFLHADRFREGQTDGQTCGSRKSLFVSFRSRVCLRAFSITYPTCKAHAPYCLRSLWLHDTFRCYLINRFIFETHLLNIKCVFWFSLQLLFKTFLILRRLQRDIVINAKTYSYKVAVSLVGL